MRGLNIYRTSYKDRKITSVKKNLVYQMIYQGVMMVTPFLTVPYLSDDSSTQPVLVRAGIFVLRKRDPGMCVVPSGSSGNA